MLPFCFATNSVTQDALVLKYQSEPIRAYANFPISTPSIPSKSAPGRDYTLQLVVEDSSTVSNRPLTLFVRHWVFTTSGNKFHQLEMRYCYPMLKDRFAEILDFWLGKSDQLETAFALVSGAQQDKDLPVRYQFLNCVHALECLDRAIANRGYMLPEDYATVRQTIANCIPRDLDSGHRESIKKKIEYGYEFSLRKRLTEMLKEMPDNLVAMICTDSKPFPNLIADTRNYFAHYTQELKEKAVLDTAL